MQTVVIGRIEDAVDGVLYLTAPGYQDNVYILNIGDVPNPPPPDHPVWTTSVVIDDLFEGEDHGADSIIETSKGPDVIWGRGGVELIKTGLGDDLVYAGPNDDLVFAGGGNDEVWGGSGHDFIDGAMHQDVLHGESGNDHLRGGHGGDDLRGGKGDDFLDGGAGIDRLTGGPDADTFLGGAKSDTFVCRPDEGDRILDWTPDEGDTLMVLLDGIETDLTAEADQWVDPQGFVRTPDPAPAPQPALIADAVVASDGATA